MLASLEHESGKMLFIKKDLDYFQEETIILKTRIKKFTEGYM